MRGQELSSSNWESSLADRDELGLRRGGVIKRVYVPVYPNRKLVCTAGANVRAAMSSSYSVVELSLYQIKKAWSKTQPRGVGLGVIAKASQLKEVVSTKGSGQANVKGRKKKCERMKRVTGRGRLELSSSA